MPTPPDTLFTVALYLLSSLVQADAAILALGAIFVIYKLQVLGSQFDFVLNYCAQNQADYTAMFMREIDKPKPDESALDGIVEVLKTGSLRTAVTKSVAENLPKLVKIRKEQGLITRLLKAPLIVIGVHISIVAILIMAMPIFNCLSEPNKAIVFWMGALIVVIAFIIGIALACWVAWNLVIAKPE
jgi:hypothetical protein